MAVSGQLESCPSCGRRSAQDAQFCGKCGTALRGIAARRRPFFTRLSLGGCALVILVIALAALSLGYADARRMATGERQARQTDVRSIEGKLGDLSARLGVLSAQDSALSRKLTAAQKESGAGVAPLASRILKSVFTIETYDGLGSGWAAWTNGGFTYLVTANHVVSGYTDL